jgi:hypothetical protein
MNHIRAECNVAEYQSESPYDITDSTKSQEGWWGQDLAFALKG